MAKMAPSSNPQKSSLLPPSKVTWTQLGCAAVGVSILLAIAIFASRQPIPCVTPDKEPSLRPSQSVANFVRGGVPARPICKDAAEPRTAGK